MTSILDGIHHPALRPGYRVMKIDACNWAVMNVDNSILGWFDTEGDAMRSAQNLEDTQ